MSESAGFLHLVGAISHDVLILALLVHCVFGASLTWLLVEHLGRRRSALDAERRLLAAPMPPDEALPRVLMQIPSFNEGNLVKRIAGAIEKLDWPREKLRVQILDDSTDDSAALAGEAVAALRRAGIDTVLLHRAVRAGFKAGALAAGLSRSSDDFIAVLDADYVPRPDFLRACMRPMLLDRDLGLVQARCDFINAGDNWLTGVQQRLLDAHFAVEQATRSWLGLILPFNGTCGIWRRAAIEDAGGWHGDMLAEDLDLSFRVQSRGWKGRYLVTVTVPGELPNSLETWRTQQFRWTKGFAQGARKLLPIVWHSKLEPWKKVAATLHLGSCMIWPVICVMIAAGAVDLAMGEGLTPLAATLLVLALGQGAVGIAMLLLLGQRLARNADILTELGRLPGVIWLSQCVALMNLRATVEAFTGRASAFVRTPKRGGGDGVVAETKDHR